MTAALVGGTNSLFSLPLGEERVEWSVWLGKEGLWKRVRTLSHFAGLEGKALEEARLFFDNALEGPDVERDGEGKIKVDGITLMVWTSKIP